MKIVPYSEAYKDSWNAFVQTSKNGLFLFDRNYMDYHKDRFPDASLMAFKDNGDLVAVIPANTRGKTIQSHGGLTFGGVVSAPDISTTRFLEAFKSMVDYYRGHGFETLGYKVIPALYHEYPAEEDLYALFLIGAECTKREVTSAIQPARRLPMRKGRKAEVKRAHKLGLTVAESDRWVDFWGILKANLDRKHGLKPVHTVDEIRMLHDRFPSNIRLFTACRGTEIQAGTVIYESRRVAHTQYIGCTEEGQETGSLDLLITHLVDSVFLGKAYFDFGISNENQGRFLNRGLIEFKEGFGARSITHATYSIDLKHVDLESLSADRNITHE